MTQDFTIRTNAMPAFSFPGGKFLGVACLLLAAGCGGNEAKRVPVSGRVALGDQPLPGGIVTFGPDAAKGNKTQVMATGMIQSDGSFELKPIDGKPGVPVGWYKVTVQLEGPGIPPPPGKKVQINPKYSDPHKTDLEVEVLEKPASDRYNFTLKK